MIELRKQEEGHKMKVELADIIDAIEMTDQYS